MPEETSRVRIAQEVIIGKVFVGNLNYDTTQSDLEDLFAGAGEIIEVFLPTDRDTGRPRGFAFVKFTDDQSVTEAIEKFDGYELQGRNIRVNEAEERRGPAPGGFPGGGGFSPKPRGKSAKPKGSRRNLRRGKRGF